MSANLGTKVLNAVKWNIVLTLSLNVFQVAFLIIISRFVSKEEFGLIAIFNMATMLCSILTTGAIKPAVIREEQSDDSFKTNCLILSIAISVFVSTIAFILYVIFGYSKFESFIPILILVLSVLISSIYVVNEAAFEKQLDYKFITILNVITYLISYLGLSLLICILGYPLEAVLLAPVFQHTMKSFYYIKNGEKFFNYTLISLLKLKTIFKFTVGVNITWFINYITLYIDNMFVTKYLGLKYLGIYSMSFNAMDMPRKFLASIVEKVSLPLFSKLISDPIKRKECFLQFLSFLTATMLIACIYIFVFAEIIVNVALGDNWKEVVPILQVLIIQIPLRACVRICDSYLTSIGKVYNNAKIKLLYLIFMLVLCFLLTRFGVIYVAMAVSISVLINMLMSIALVSKLEDIKLTKIINSFSTSLKITSYHAVFLILMKLYAESIYVNKIHLMSIFIPFTLILLGAMFLFDKKVRSDISSIKKLLDR